jgi:2-polyprenyl-3-methyl-5-hydroxy-6-metoxy-1,4-benzoquinol methylase
VDFRSYIREQALGKRILEIGPSYNPITPRRDGFEVTVMDHADAASLRVKYAEFGVDVSKVEEVDIVSTDLGELVTAGRRFDVIVASHMIEHTTDVIGFLKSCDALLDNGRLMLIVPDKRFCFDHFRPNSTAGNAIDAYFSQRKRHLGGLFDHYANFVLNSDLMAWEQTAKQDLKCLHGGQDAAHVLKKALESNDYFDAHEWTFTPTSFRLMMRDLQDAGLVKLRQSFFHPQVGCEFMAIMSQGPAREEDVSRRSLLDEIERESVLSSQFFCEKDFDGTLAEASVLMNQQAEEISKLRQQIALANEECDRHSRTIECIKNSTSWRLTGPLRALKAALMPG